MRAIYVLLAACAAHDPALDSKLDTIAAAIAANQRAVDALRTEVEHPQVAATPPRDDSHELEHRIDDLDKKIDRLQQQLATNNQPPPRRRAEPDKSAVYAVKVDGFPTDGPADAKVTMVWVHDYADPFSNKSRDVVADLHTKYGADFRVVYRDLVVHPQVATAGALAACAANKQKQFIAFDKLLWEKGFANRQFDKDGSDGKKCWESADGCPVVRGFAAELGLDLKRFEADMKACVAPLAADAKELQAFGVGATPTFYINGRVLVGAMPATEFETLIDEELAKANQSKVPKAQYYKRAVLDKGLTKLEEK